LTETQNRIHIIAENLSAHNTKLVKESLKQHPNIQIHYTPTYSSWLNQAQKWFAKIQRQVITRGVPPSRADLHRKLMRFIKHYNRTATPIKWTYSNPSKPI
jgi:transposase